MRNSLKPIRLSEHAKEQLIYRGATEREVLDTIQKKLHLRKLGWAVEQLLLSALNVVVLWDLWRKKMF